MGDRMAATAITAKLPDGSDLELADGATGADAAAAIGPGLAKAALAVKVDGELRDLTAPLPDGAALEIVTSKSPEALDLMRHDAAHVLATAVVELWPGTKVSIGPPIADGFYYDFEFPEGVSLSEDDLPRIEEKIAEHIAADEAFERSDVTVDDALGALPRGGGALQGRADRGPRPRRGRRERLAVPKRPLPRPLPRPARARRPGRIEAIKLSSVAGAYWRGDETRQMLTRIYGTAFFSKKDLEAHLERLELARANDHRKLGPQLGLFMLRGEAPGDAVLAAQGHGPAAADRGRRCETSCAAAATRRSRPRRSWTSSSGTARATGTTTARTCSSPSPPSATATRARAVTRCAR